MKFFKYHFPFILWMAIIFIQSSYPAIELPKVEFFSSDKVIHMGVYGLLAMLCFISFIHQKAVLNFYYSPLAWTFIIVSVYGASDEFHQTFVPYRSGEIPDLIADVIGVLIMLLLIKC